MYLNAPRLLFIDVAHQIHPLFIFRTWKDLEGILCGGVFKGWGRNGVTHIQSSISRIDKKYLTGWKWFNHYLGGNLSCLLNSYDCSSYIDVSSLSVIDFTSHVGSVYIYIYGYKRNCFLSSSNMLVIIILLKSSSWEVTICHYCSKACTSKGKKFVLLFSLCTYLEAKNYRISYGWQFPWSPQTISHGSTIKCHFWISTALNWS